MSLTGENALDIISISVSIISTSRTQLKQWVSPTIDDSTGLTIQRYHNFQMIPLCGWWGYGNAGSLKAGVILYFCQKLP